jgi:hypothetical protein
MGSLLGSDKAQARSDCSVNDGIRGTKSIATAGDVFRNCSRIGVLVVRAGIEGVQREGCEEKKDSWQRGKGSQPL